jgi:hypothetical protein
MNKTTNVQGNTVFIIKRYFRGIKLSSYFKIHNLQTPLKKIPSETKFPTHK